MCIAGLGVTGVGTPLGNTLYMYVIPPLVVSSTADQLTECPIELTFISKDPQVEHWTPVD